MYVVESRYASALRTIDNRDTIACSLLIMIGFAWFAVAEVAYDGSLMEDPFLRSGMFAMWYVPLATMYLVKAIKGEGRAAGALAGLLAFLAFWAMIAIDVWVTHYKPNCDICHIPAQECFAMESIMALVVTVLASFSDVVSARMVRKTRHPIARFWLVRRAMRIVGTVLLTLLSCVLTYWIVYVALRVVWFIWKLIT